MPKQVTALYAMDSTRQVAEFMDKVIDKVENGASKTDVFDSVCNEAGFSAPPVLQPLLSSLKDDDEKRIFDSIVAGTEVYRREHGVYPTADLVEAAMQQGHAAMIGLTDAGTKKALDSATNQAHDQGSLQPNRAVVAILSAISEGIPWASYLPVDIGSNQAKLAILSHLAESNFGGYLNGAIMDGIDSGKLYTTAQRLVKFDISGAAPYNRAFTQRNLANEPDYCDPAATGVGVYRGRTIVYVNGMPVAQDQLNGSGATSPFTGTFTLPGGATQFTITGSVTLATGAITITAITGGTLPAGTEVTAKSVIDFETQSALTPRVGVRADVFDLYATSSRVLTQLGIDPEGQMRNELGLDPMSEALMAIRTQMANERHYLALRMAYNLGRNNIVNLDFDYSNQKTDKTRAQIWQDQQGIFGNADQNMANLTMDHGITHIYAPGFIISQWEGCGRDIWEPSGLPKRPGIFRAGRLYGQYEVYYAPRVANQNNATLQTAQLVAVGRSTNVARNPVVMGDAVAPTFVDVATGQDFKKQAGMYSRNFTEVNPHVPSALGCALIDVSDLS